MYISYRSLLTVAAVLLFPRAFAEIKVSDLIFDDRRYAHPFDVKFTISDDFVMQLDLSTATSSLDSICAIGPDISDSLSYHERYIISQFHNPRNITEFIQGDWEIEGSLWLDAGLVATIDVAAHWGVSVSHIALARKSV